MNDLQSGTLAERYVVEGVLGAGSMATVYRVRHVDLGTAHAMKVMALAGESLRQRMLQEGRIQAGLRHPNVVAVTDVVRIAGAPALVMEYVEGPTLEQLLARYHPSIAQADTIAQDILRGVAAAHAQGLVHRDLKPANVLLATVGTTVMAKVADFGIAKVLLGEVPMSSTQTGTTMGTPTFMAPEQFRNAKDVDTRADVFSLGAILYELLTGTAAFSGTDLIACFQDASEGRYVPVRSRVPSAPARMVRAIEGALQPDREERLPDANVLLRVWRGEDEGVVVSVPPSERAWEGEHLAVLDELMALRREPREASAATPATRAWSPGAQPTMRPVNAPPTGGRWLAVGAFAGTALFLAFGTVAVGAWWWVGEPDAAASLPVEAPPLAVASTAAAPPTPSPLAVPLSVAPSPSPSASVAVVPPAKPTPVAPARADPPKPVAAATAPAVEPDNVVVLNAGKAYFLDASGSVHPPGHLAPGDYTLYAYFDDITATRAATVHVEPGRRYTFRCTPGFRICKMEEG